MKFLVSTIFLFGCSRGTTEPKSSEVPITVETVSVQFADAYEVEETYAGTVRSPRSGALAFERAGKVVRLRFYSGLSVEETAEIMQVSARTVAREWSFARARLFQLLEERPG